jgi:DinB superfamily
MDAIALLQLELRAAHTWCEQTLGADTEALHRVPAGSAHAPAVAYAHAVASEDQTINGWLRSGTPLSAGEWAGRTGMSEPMVMGPTYATWTERVRIDVPQVRAYAQAVYTASDAWLASLTEADLDRALDVPGVGTQPLAWILAQWVIGHVHDETGEISAIKGVSGLIGYPEV